GGCIVVTVPSNHCDRQCRVGCQPCRCLCRPLVQITLTCPCRRTIWHLSQIRLTLGLTFTSAAPALSLLDTVPATRTHSLVAVYDPPARQVVRRKLHDDLVLGKNTDIVLPHLATD